MRVSSSQQLTIIPRVGVEVGRSQAAYAVTDEELDPGEFAVHHLIETPAIDHFIEPPSQFFGTPVDLFLRLAGLHDLQHGNTGGG